MNQYAQTARAYLEEKLPSLASSMTSEEWTSLGERLNQEIGDLAAQLAGPDPRDEAHLDKVARLNTARMRATEIVMHDEIYSRVPETDPADPEPEVSLTELHQALTQAQAAMLDLSTPTSRCRVAKAVQRGLSGRWVGGPGDIRELAGSGPEFGDDRAAEAGALGAESDPQGRQRRSRIEHPDLVA